MSTSIHHVGLRVTDMDAAERFYVGALGGRWLARPVPLQGRSVERAAGIAQARVRIALVGYGDAMVELFEYDPQAAPEWALSAQHGRLPHLCLRVDDTAAATERAIDAGGRALWDGVDRFGGVAAMYLEDPFGNVVELLDGPPAAIVDGFHRAFPESRPA